MVPLLNVSAADVFRPVLFGVDMLRLQHGVASVTVKKDMFRPACWAFDITLTLTLS
jgi:hypothetical protein